MKIEITPKVIEAFNEEGKPAIVTIGSKGIMFNKIAERLLALNPEATFLLDFEDGSMYYKESTEGFKLNTSGKYNLLSAQVPNCGKYIDKFFKKGLAVYRFEVGEFKDGRRKLSLVA